MKKYLFLAIALLGLASCAKEDLTNGNEPIHNGEIEESYIAINLSASDITRAQSGYDDGTDEERAVIHADFFFFDEAGNPFNVNVSKTDNDEWTGGTEGTGTGRNHLRVTTINWTKDEDSDDISDTAAPVMLLRTYKGEYPSQIVAVLNWSPAAEPYSLSALHDAVNVQSTFGGKNYFVMSNAVYAQNGNAVYATPLTIDNIKKSEVEAKNAPVTIYVERVAAKVTVKSKADSNNKFDVGQDFTYTTTEGENTTTTTDVYAHIVGWELYNDNPQSKLLKEIDATWSDTDLGFTWNDAPWYRCFWANSLAMPNDTVSNTAPFGDGGYTYIGENTTANNTKVIIKAVLKNADGTQVAEIALWNNVQYVGELALRTAVANTLVNTYYSYTNEGDKKVYTGLKPEDLQCVAGGGEGAPGDVKANEVYFQLSNEGKTKDWYKLVNGEYTPVAATTANDDNSIDATNEALKSIPSAVLYKDGETFYYVDIKHLGKRSLEEPEKAVVGEYGVVRNHIYDIVIRSIKGYGSPVYEGIQLVEYPTTPEQSSFVSAQINILSWRLVNQEVNIQPNN